MRLPPAPPVARAVAATPPDRDRVLDLVRAGSLAVVVLGHSAMGVIGWTASGPMIRTALDFYPWASWATWLLQIMPLFFLAGGAVNARSWRRTTTSYAAWTWKRTDRLLRPVWVYLLIMAPLSGLVSALAPSGWASPLLGLTTQLLWFVGVYVMVCATTPLLVRGHAVNPALVPAVLLTSVAVVDWLRIGQGLVPIGLLSFLLVWAFAADLGLLFDSGLLRGWRGAVTSATAVAVNLMLIRWGPYPVSMVGGSPGERFSNMAPPSLALALHALALAGVVGVIRPLLGRAAAQAKVWWASTAISLTAMTLYLWHLPVLIALVALSHLVGLDRPVVWTLDGPRPGAGYWLATVLFLAVDLLAVTAVVRVLWVAEAGRLPWWDDPSRTLADTSGRPRSVAAATGTVLVGIGTLMLSATGLTGFPTRLIDYAGLPLSAPVAILLMLAGGALVRASGTRRSPKLRSDLRI